MKCMEYPRKDQNNVISKAKMKMIEIFEED